MTTIILSILISALSLGAALIFDKIFPEGQTFTEKLAEIDAEGRKQ